MEALNNKYEKLVVEEDELLLKIQTCDAYLMAVLDYTYQKGSRFHELTIEEILMTIHQTGSDFRMELLHVRFEKALVAGNMKLLN